MSASFANLFTERRCVAGSLLVLSDYKQFQFWFLAGLIYPVVVFFVIFASVRISLLEMLALMRVSYIIKL